MTNTNKHFRPIVVVLSFIIILCYPAIVKSQTISAEEKNLNQKIGKLPQEQMVQLANSWRNFIKDYGRFPDLPYDSSTNTVTFKYVDNCGLDKSIIFDRMMEWGALRFGSIDAVLQYKNLESGKIIMKGYFAINYKEDYQNMWGNKREKSDTKDVYATYVFTIKDNKVKTEVTGIEVEFVSSGYSGASYYVPASKKKYPIDALFPITDADPILWKEHLNILKAINHNIESTHVDLINYLRDYNDDYNF